MQLALFDKRWSERREVWRAPSDVFSPAGWAVDVAEERAARPFVERHHYAGTFPPARLSVALWGPGPTLQGAAVFSVGVRHDAALRRYAGVPGACGVELGRFVCSPAVAFNGESWFLARALRALRDELGVSVVLSYADPLERRTEAGELMKRAHWGTIYQASNALHVGRAEARWLYLAADGRIVSGRALTKIRKQEQGHGYAERALVSMGAPARQLGEDPAAWVSRALACGAFRRIWHPGNLAYLFTLDAGAAAAARAIHGAGLPYPHHN